MSNYTTELRFICESIAKVPKSKGYRDIREIIEKSRKEIFCFYYPIFDENYRRALETKIIRHYYTREICEETVGLWLLRLEDKMNEIMPYYNKLYESELLKFNPFYDIDYTLTHKGRANEAKKQKTRHDNQNTTDFTEGVDTINKTVTAEDITDNTKTVENTDNNTTGNIKTHETDDKTTHETTNSVTDTTDDKDTVITDVEDVTRDKNITLHDVENTQTVENETSNTVAHKIGDNTTQLKDDGHDVDTTVLDGTKVRTPDLTTDKKTDDVTHDGGSGADNRNINRSEDTVTDDHNEGTENYTGVKNFDESNLDLYSDTPQGNLMYPNQGTTDQGGSIAYSPNNDFATNFPISLSEALAKANEMNLTADEWKEWIRVLKARIDSRYLTNARDISSVHNENDGHTTTTETNQHKFVDFDETTDDNVTHLRNYETTVDGHVVTTDTGNETVKTDDTTTLTKEIDETHTTHYDIDETTTTDFTDEKTGTKDYTKDQTENTHETEHTDYNRNMNEAEKIHSVTDTTHDKQEDETMDRNVDSVEDFTGLKDTNEDYTRDRDLQTDFVGDKKTVSNRIFLENLTGELDHNIRNMDEYINHAVGKISDTTYSKMLLEFRDTFINIDKMIIDDLNDLFFMLF